MGPIGIFDSGYGGLTVFKEIEQRLPSYDYLYLGDNARVPYGNRSEDTVYRFTKECIETLFDRGCSLVILACNTASAMALRKFQQEDLPHYPSLRKVLGVIRPTSEQVGHYSKRRKIGVLATDGTIASGSYLEEFKRFYPDVEVFQQACPMWVPLIEQGDLNSPAAHHYVQFYLRQLMDQSADIDTVVLGCTHYPLLYELIRYYLPKNIMILGQGKLVAESLEEYLIRHPELKRLCLTNGQRTFLTTDDPETFEEKGQLFYGRNLKAKQLHVGYP